MDTRNPTHTQIALLEVEPAQTVKGYLIDPISHTIKQIEYNGQVEHLYQLIGCRVVDLVELSNGDVAFVDDEGLFSATHGFLIEGKTLAGKGVILGTGSEGDSVDAKHSLKELVFKTRMGQLQRRGG